MPTAGGPNTLGESSLVFAYDTGDVSNSYLGEPTANLINPNAPNIYSWWTRNVQTITQLTETYKGQPIYRVSLSIDNGDMLYHITERWGAGSGWYMPYVTFNANTPYIASVVYRPVSHPDTRIYGHPSNIGGWGATVDGSTDIDNQWKIHRIDRNFGNTVGDNRFYHMHTPSATLGQTVTVDITNSQIEQKNHSTPFVNGTRSATQGLLPVIGNSTIDLSNVSFDSSAKMVFDGTNDYVNLGSYLHNIDTSTLSIEIVFKTNVVTGNALILLGWHENEYPHGYICLGNFTGHWGNETISFYNEGPGTTALSFAYTNGHSLLSDTLYHHVVFILQTNNYKIYIDGVEVAVNASFRNGSQSTVMPSNLFGYGTTPSVVLGAGSDPANSFFNGNIPITKIYNRALTALEVKQNYQQHKTRFNLS